MEGEKHCFAAILELAQLTRILWQNIYAKKAHFITVRVKKIRGAHNSY